MEEEEEELERDLYRDCDDESEDGDAQMEEEEESAGEEERAPTAPKTRRSKTGRKNTLKFGPDWARNTVRIYGDSDLIVQQMGVRRQVVFLGCEGEDSVAGGQRDVAARRTYFAGI